MRADGTRVRGLSPIVQALPYIMPRRYDAQNWANDYVDEEILRNYIRQKRRDGLSVTHMSVLVAAYYKAALENPKVNYFIMNRKVYRRNHFCFSFVILKTRADGTPDETTLKIYLKPEDTVFSISQRIKEHIDRNLVAAHNNRTDRFAAHGFFGAGAGPGGVLDSVSSGPSRAAAQKDHRTEPLSHQSVHHESGLHQHQLYFSPLL